MENNIKNLKKVTLEEQKQIEESSEKICADVAIAALKWANNNSFVLDDAVKDTRQAYSDKVRFRNNQKFIIRLQNFVKYYKTSG